jgi:amino acid adenylation domain-containing protein
MLAVETQQLEEPIKSARTPDRSHRCVHQWFDEQAQRTPQAVAVEFEGDALTYLQLEQRANDLAGYLRALGVGPDRRVGLCIKRSLEMVVGVLGILKAGGAYVPLDPLLPQERLFYQVANAACTVVLTQNSLLPLLKQIEDAASPPLLVAWETVTMHAAANAQQPAAMDPHHLAYVLYTSGSTGRPKGVEMPHRPLLNLLRWQCAVSPMAVGNRTLQFASLGFDVSFQEMFATWLSGGTLVLVTDETRKDPAALLAFLSASRVDRLFVPYYVLERLAEAAAARDLHPGPLKEVVVAGEQLRISPDIRRFFTALPGCRLWNQYGPTEAHVVSSHELHGAPAGWPDLPPIGRALPNCQLYVLDPEGRPVAAGDIGELHIGGKVLARGYLNAPELTAERFVADPFRADRESRMYKTGDLARELPDGALEFLGRIDHQVKIRGYRIELGEVEVILGSHPELAACAVVARMVRANETVLTAFVVAREGSEPTIGELRKWLGAKLPDYMIPTVYRMVQALPLSPNGKVDRQALAQLDGAALSTGTTYVAAANPVEAQLVEIWQRLFKRDGIGCHDNFFDLGGHSLLAVALTAEIEQQMNCKLPIAALLQSPTIAELARRFTDANWSPAWKSLVPLQPSGIKPPLFLLHGWGGDVYGFVHLAQLLAPAQPVYGLQAVGLDGEQARHTTVESMAAHYVAEIRAFQPEGPYFLGGYSLGGLIAFEVAQQLYRLNQQVAVLALMDSEPCGGIPWTIYGKTLAAYFSRRGVHHLRQWMAIPPREWLPYLRGRWSVLRYLLDRNRNKAAVVTVPPPMDSEPPKVPGFNDYYHAVASTYRLRPYPGKMDFFASHQSDARWLLSWRFLVRGGVTFHEIPCQHEEIISPDYVPVLAAAMNEVLTAAQPPPRAPTASPHAVDRA